MARPRPRALCAPPRLAPPVRVEHAQRPAPRTSSRRLAGKGDVKGAAAPEVGEERDSVEDVFKGSVACWWFETLARGFVQR